MTAIEWTDETWNPATGCDRVSPGCDNCYIERTIPFRMEGRRFDENGRMGVRLHPDRLDKPLHWRKPRRVFVNSLSDLFHQDVPDEFIAQVFGVMALAGRHSFQVLTKRPQRMARLHDIYAAAPVPNVWLGTSVENQRYADLRIRHLLATPAEVRFLSIEPLLGPVDLRAWLHPRSHLTDGAWHDDCQPCQIRRQHGGTGMVHWIIVGGESGPGHRVMDLAWLEDIAERCDAVDVPLFVKQDSHARSSQQGRIPDRLWTRKDYPAVAA